MGCRPLCDLHSGEGGRRQRTCNHTFFPLSLPSPWLLRRVGSREGWDVVLRLPVELNRSHHSRLNTMKGLCIEVQGVNVCSCVIKHAGVAWGNSSPSWVLASISSKLSSSPPNCNLPLTLETAPRKTYTLASSSMLIWVMKNPFHLANEPLSSSSDASQGGYDQPKGVQLWKRGVELPLDISRFHTWPLCTKNDPHWGFWWTAAGNLYIGVFCTIGDTRDLSKSPANPGLQGLQGFKGVFLFMA